MESVLRGLAVYFFLLLVFRVAGRRTLSQTTPFEFVLLLIISETIQEAMVDGDHSMTHGFLLVLTLVGTSLLLSYIKIRFRIVERWLDGLPTVILRDGKFDHEVMAKLRVDEEDVLEAARMDHGLERLEQIKDAVVERGGHISVVPREKS